MSKIHAVVVDHDTENRLSLQEVEVSEAAPSEALVGMAARRGCEDAGAGRDRAHYLRFRRTFCPGS